MEVNSSDDDEDLDVAGPSKKKREYSASDQAQEDFTSVAKKHKLRRALNTTASSSSTPEGQPCAMQKVDKVGLIIILFTVTYIPYGVTCCVS